jgi:hypothetical protein
MPVARPSGLRRIEGVSESFESDSGQEVLREGAETLASQFVLSNCKTHQEQQHRFGRLCPETLNELIHAIATWPGCSDESEL